MNRKTFLRSSLLAGGTAFAGAPLVFGKAGQGGTGREKSDFNLNYAPHFGMFRHHAGGGLIDQLKFMADAGFTALEDNGLMGRSPEMQEKIGRQLAQSGMQMDV